MFLSSGSTGGKKWGDNESVMNQPSNHCNIGRTWAATTIVANTGPGRTKIVLDTFSRVRCCRRVFGGSRHFLDIHRKGDSIITPCHYYTPEKIMCAPGIMAKTRAAGPVEFAGVGLQIFTVDFLTWF